MQKIINVVRMKNPYPEDIFIEPTKAKEVTPKDFDELMFKIEEALKI